jgi:hypothetical protein
VKLTTHLQLVPRSRKCGSIHPLPRTSSWDNFTVPTSKFSKWSATFSRCGQISVCISHLCHACYNLRPSRPSYELPRCAFPSIILTLDAKILEFSAICTVSCSITSVIKGEYMFHFFLLKLIRGLSMSLQPSVGPWPLFQFLTPIHSC